jgi:hypothetical protein
MLTIWWRFIEGTKALHNGHSVIFILSIQKEPSLSNTYTELRGEHINEGGRGVN